MFHLQADFTQSGACSLRAASLGYFSQTFAWENNPNF